MKTEKANLLRSAANLFDNSATLDEILNELFNDVINEQNGAARDWKLNSLQKTIENITGRNNILIEQANKTVAIAESLPDSNESHLHPVFTNLFETLFNPAK